MDPHAALLETSTRPSALRRVMCAVPGLRWLYHRCSEIAMLHDPERRAFLTNYPAGHYYSPLPVFADVRRALARPPDRRAIEASGVPLHDEAQCALAASFAAYGKDLPFGAEGEATGCRYHYGNTWFEACDALVLHAMLRHFRPPRVLEVGSGFSTAMSLDTSERFLGGAIDFTFIEPNPYRLNRLIREQDRARHTVIRSFVWEVPLERFTALGAGDFLFIDTSHVLKVASDVHFLFFEVLPRLAPGVIVHLHDIFWPFEYPEDWFAMGRAYNEAYLVRALLMGGDLFEILLFNDYLQAEHPGLLEQALPPSRGSHGSSLWLRKTK